MSTISIRVPDQLLKETEERAKSLDLPRAAYVRLALEAMNHSALEKARAKHLMEVSRKVRGESMRVNAEFDAIE